MFLILRYVPHPSAEQSVWHNGSAQCLHRNRRPEAAVAEGPGVAHSSRKTKSLTEQPCQEPLPTTEGSKSGRLLGRALPASPCPRAYGPRAPASSIFAAAAPGEVTICGGQGTCGPQARALSRRVNGAALHLPVTLASACSILIRCPLPPLFQVLKALPGQRASVVSG